MPLRGVIFKAVVCEEGVRGERDKTDGDACHEKDETLGKSEHILLDPRGCRFSFLVFDLLDTENFLDGGDNVAEDVVFGDDIGVGLSSVDDDKLIVIFIVPNGLVDAVGDELHVVIGLGGGEEEVHLAVLVLQDQFGTIFIGEDAEDGVIGLMLHDYAFVFDVVVLEAVGVVEVDEEDLREEVLHDLPITFHWEHTLLRSLAFDLYQMDLVLIVEDGCPVVADLDPLYVVLALDLIHLLSP